ncbi:hypothetical protein MKX01_013271 [Papaver californicum]|nr:hypothetical protein MKX01_013271 [Papaver californicum]
MELQDVTKSDISSSTIDISPTLDEPLKCIVNDGVAHRRVLEPRPIRFVLSFSNLKYSVKTRRNWSFGVLFCQKNRLLNALEVNPAELESNYSRKKVLLNDISGEAKEGEIMAVLGASGSGISTLIDALANRISKGSLQESVTLNGEVLESRTLKMISAYVMQDDLPFPMLTVEETLMFSAEFRLPRTLSKSKKLERVRALIVQLGLQNAANTCRRVSIGVDIIHDPILLFLDEPTSGLESTSAFMVVKFLQQIARSGSIVVMSVHQPSYRILKDKVYNGSPKNLSMFFSEFGHPIPENENPTEFSLDFIRELEVSPGGTKRSSIPESPSLKNAISSSISSGKLVFVASKNDATTPTSIIATFTNPFWFEIYVLSKRSMINSTRTPKLFLARLATKRYIFMRETAYNAYRGSSYVLSHSIVTIPALIMLSIAFAATTFWAVGLSGGFSGFLFFFIAILASFWAGSSFVTFLSGVVPDVIGFFISRDRIPPYWFWFHYISLVNYPFEGVLQNEFDDPSKLFPTDEKLKLLKTLSKSLGVSITRNTCVSTGVDILGKLGLNDISKWSSIWITLVWGFFFRTLFYFYLLFGSKNKRV